ncbi:hypothetical protein [Paractinoplanes deccanensis]|nr:hypothetical protein [Actinoplanes deccanensis]
MATVIEALTALAEQVNRVSAAQATSFTNLQNAIAELKRGELTDEQARLVAQIEDSLTTLADDAQRGDDGYEPQQSGDGQPDVVLPETDPQEPGAEEPTVTEPKVPAEPADETTLRR